MRHGGRALAGLAVVVAGVLALGVFAPSPALWLSDITYPIVAIGAGLLVAVGARYRSGRSRLSWILFGIGIGLFGVGELSWSWYELTTGVEPSTPGLPDVFYLAGYPVLGAAIFLTPRFGPNNYQRGQQLVDAAVASIGLVALAWWVVVEPMQHSSRQVAVGEFLVGVAYPVGDALLIAAIGIFGLRRATHAGDRASWYVVVGLVLMAAGNLIYAVDSWSVVYSSGTWMDAIWLVGYGLFALAASHLPQEPEESLPREGRLPIWMVMIPVAIVLTLATVHIATERARGEDITVELTIAGLVTLILVRIILVVAEDRQLVDNERKRLVSVVSHELRTPLTAVDGFIDIVLENWDELPDAEKREMIETAREQTGVVTRIVTDLVAASRDNLQTADLDMEIVDVTDIIRNAVPQLGLSDRLQLEFASRSRVVADPIRLTQVVSNLIGNAGHYGGEGPIRCVVADQGDEVEIAIHDGGPGVPARFQQNIWRPFERGSRRFDASTPGSGLGLAIVRSLVEAHRGSVGYRRSELLGGACFWVRLPRHQVDVSARTEWKGWAPAPVGPR